MPRVFASHARPASPRRARTAGEEYGGTAEPSWREVDWASHLRRGRFAGAEVNYVDMAPDGPRRGRTGRPCCSSTASAASGRTGSRTSPAWRSTAAW